MHEPTIFWLRHNDNCLCPGLAVPQCIQWEPFTHAYHRIRDLLEVVPRIWVAAESQCVILGSTLCPLVGAHFANPAKGGGITQ